MYICLPASGGTGCAPPENCPSGNHQPEGCDLLAPLPPRKFHLGLSHWECKELVLLPPFRHAAGLPGIWLRLDSISAQSPPSSCFPPFPFPGGSGLKYQLHLRPCLKPCSGHLNQDHLGSFSRYFFLLFYSITSDCPLPLLLLIILNVFHFPDAENIENEALILNKCAEPALSRAGTCRHAPSNPAVRSDHLVGR